MEVERKLVEYVLNTRFEDIPEKPVSLMKSVVLNTLGGVIAGATVPGCPEAVGQCKEWGGKKEATILIHGGRVSAHNAAFANSFMARAVLVDDAIPPGLHTGASAVPTALAVAELAGGCSGKEFLTALTVGAEIAARINSFSVYDGLEPTGVCVVFAATAIAGRIVGLNKEQMWNALGHAFNRSWGSAQGTLDGSVAARVIQGSASQGGIISAQIAQKGVTGPKNFLQGMFGYFHYHATDTYGPEAVVEGLGTRFEMGKTFLKKYSSCGTTLSSIDAIFELMKEKGITHENLAEMKIRVTPSACELTGQPFQYGDDPRISGMYSIQYCVANALFRKSCKLVHFDAPEVREPRIMEIVHKIQVASDPALDQRSQLATEMEVRTRDGAVYHKRVDFPRGMPENPMSREELMEKFQDCVSYAGKPLPEGNGKRIVSLVEGLEKVKDVRRLVPLLISKW